jgi:hypothetical protein
MRNKFVSYGNKNVMTMEEYMTTKKEHNLTSREQITAKVGTKI